ncbi:MAG: outer membrane protein assembly factor BamA, partial [Arcobacteraceae bacterium]|nr:outer membrane protein assembly factor BamA [Arcobacteraceae bacterium]
MKILFSILLSISIIQAQYITKEIKFEGLTQISKKIALEKLNIKIGEEYTSSQINTSLKDFYKFNYFKNIEIFDNNGTLILIFTEKPFIVNLEMTGYKTRDDDLKDIFSAMNIKKGNMYTKEKIKKSKNILLEELKKEGYINSVVEVEIENINDQGVSVKFNINKGAEVIIKKVNYIGAKELSNEHFEENTANKQEDLISWWFGQNDGVMQFSQLEYDNHRIKDIYLQNGYLDAKVSSAFSQIDFNTNSAVIDFSISEGQQYLINNITIYTDEKIVPLKELKEDLKEIKGKVFNISKLRKDVEYLRTKIANKGYAFTQVNYDIRKNKKEATADIIFNIIPGEKVYINDVIIAGNNRTLDRVIRRNIYLAPKDLFNLTDFKDSKNALNRTGFFNSVKVKQKKVSKTLMDLIVTVKEAPTGNLILGGGYGSYDGWMINASVNDKNIFGSGLDLGFSLEHSSKKDTATISLKNPAINDGIYNGSLSIYKNSSLIEADDTSTSGDETTDTIGGSVGVGRTLTRHSRIGIIYALEQQDVQYTKDFSLNNSYTTSSLTPYINFNNTDNYYIARKGISTGTSLKYVGLGGDAQYIQSSNYFKYFYGLEDKIDYDIIFRYKTSIKVMYDHGEIPTGTTYYLGGPSSVRGYQSYAFQPEDNAAPFKKLFTNTIELSFPLIPKAKMRWSLFYDYGMAGETNFGDIKKSGKGISINWYSPVGPLQFIFADAINP